MLLLLGVPVCGLAISSYLRSARLRWTWALLGAVVCVPLRPLAAAFVLAALVALRRHRGDLAAGGDIALAAEERTGPLQMLRARLAARGPLLDERGLAVGRDSRGVLVRIPLGGAAGRHTLIVGATGSGKTVSSCWLLANAIRAGHGAVIVDPKGDRLLHDTAREAAQRTGRTFSAWTPEGGCAYNPFAHGSAAEIADKALAAEEFSEPHYLRQAQRYLGHAARALRCSGATPTPQRLAELMDPQALEVLARQLADEPRAEALFRYLDELDGRARAGLAGTRDRLAILAESELGAWLGEPVGVERIDLLEAARTGAVVYFRLDADRLPLLASMLAAAIVQDLLTVAVELQRTPAPLTVAIDEFSAIAPHAVARLFGRARAAGVSLLLATQELADLRDTSSAALLDQVLGNVTTVVAHRQVVPASAELIARMGGTRAVWSVSQQLDGARPSGRSTRTRAYEGRLEATTIAELEPGCAAVLLPGGQGAHLTRMFSPEWGEVCDA